MGLQHRDPADPRRAVPPRVRSPPSTAGRCSPTSSTSPACHARRGMSDRLRPLIGRAAEGPLSREQAESAFTAIMDGDATPAQVGGFLMALRTRGETVAEYAAAAAVMRARCLRVRAPEGAIDIVGTGGDGKGTLNISTAAALRRRRLRRPGRQARQPQPLVEVRRRRRPDRARRQRHGRPRGGRAGAGRGRHRLHDGADAPPGDPPRHARPPGARHPHHLQPARTAHQSRLGPPPAHRRLSPAR